MLCMSHHPGKVVGWLSRSRQDLTPISMCSYGGISVTKETPIKEIPYVNDVNVKDYPSDKFVDSVHVLFILHWVAFPFMYPFIASFSYVLHMSVIS